MIRRFILITLTFWLAACSAHDEHYYSQNPNALQEVLKNCEQNPSKELNCTQLRELAMRMNDFASQLRDDPQGYGQKILALQETIATQESELAKRGDQTALKPQLADNKKQLSERLAVVKWLESPER